MRVRPAGRVPADREQVYGPVPPVTPTVPLYGEPAVAAGGELSVSTAVPVFAGFEESITATVRFVVPAAVGVPLTRQLAPRVRPAGSIPPVIVQA